MTEQLSMFEPTGVEVLDIAGKHERLSRLQRASAETLSVEGWVNVSRTLHASADRSERLAAEMYMLAEFEALGGITP